MGTLLQVLLVVLCLYLLLLSYVALCVIPVLREAVAEDRKERLGCDCRTTSAPLAIRRTVTIGDTAAADCDRPPEVNGDDGNTRGGGGGVNRQKDPGDGNPVKGRYPL